MSHAASIKTSFFYALNPFSMGPIGCTICILIMMIFIYSLFSGWRNVKLYINQIKYLTNHLNTNYRRNDGEQVRVKEDLDTIFKGKHLFEHSWQEFSESLIYIKVGDEAKVGNTIDAEHFFSLRKIVKGLGWHSAVPGMLTGLGILGTFVGIIDGLQHLDISKIELAIVAFIGGMKVAFGTSVWGLLLALIYTLLEKKTIAKMENSIDEFNNAINRIYPRSTSEHFLAEIKSYSEDQITEIKHLATDIGKTVVSGFSKLGLNDEEISESIKQGINVGYAKLSEEIKCFTLFQQQFVSQSNLINETNKNLSIGLAQLTEANIRAGRDIETSASSVKSAAESVERSAISVETAIKSSYDLIKISSESLDSQRSMQESLSEIGITIQGIISELAPNLTKISDNVTHLTQNLIKTSHEFKAQLVEVQSSTNDALDNSYRAIDTLLAEAIRKLAGGVSSLNQFLSEIDSVAKMIHDRQIEFENSRLIQISDKKNAA